ncbi:MAG: methylmalonyl-CoA epimerase [Candidatus Marinimicrobia bacterium CG1_02_48_14]|nr:MAG: methylmalonyl-CoA epimerase [Candidatus Marinimicrobia bacterium CG1_02_48_14]
MKIIKIDHVAIATHNPSGFQELFEKLMGIPFDGVETVPNEGVNTYFYPVGGTSVELLEPLNADAGLVKFLQKRGAGLHHIAMLVEGLDDMVARLKQSGVQFTSETPTKGAHGKRIIFIHPKSAGGVLIELSEQQTDS